MKKKYWIAGTVAVIVLIAAIVLLLMQNNNSEFRIQNSELNAETVSTAVLAAEDKDNSEFRIQNSELNVELENTVVPAGEEKEETVKETAEAEEKDQPFLVQITDDDPSIAYVLIRMPNPIGLLPLPLEGEYVSVTLR